MTISRPWKGYGSAIFLELGQLSTQMSSERGYDYGEACIDIQWDWRLESDIEVVCGSSNSSPEIELHMGKLLDLSIAGIAVNGQPSELTVQLSNGLRLRSMAMVSGDPQWAIQLKDKTWLSCDRGILVASDGAGGREMKDEERAVSDRATKTAKRWGRPSAEPVQGQCRDCTFYIRLDGNFALLDYGACTSPISPFDGQITNMESGCAAFSEAT